MELFNILVGIALLFFGRRLFWLFVAGAGFLAGTLLASVWFDGLTDGMSLLFAMCLGLIGAVLSIFLQKAIVGIAGFLAGGYLAHTLTMSLGYSGMAWIMFVLGGIIGVVLLLAVFDWALIALSSLTGATMIIQQAPLDQMFSVILFLVLAIVGVAVQVRQLVPPAPAPRGSPT
jgi:hypothetical protein